MRLTETIIEAIVAELIAYGEPTEYDLDYVLAKQQLAMAIRKYDDHGTKYVSKGLANALRNAGIPVEMCIYHLIGSKNQQQAIMHKFLGSSATVFEHTKPVGKVVDELLAGKSLAEAKGDSPIVWVLKSEDQELNRLGYGRRRPNGWQSAYAEAGIEVLEIAPIDGEQ